MAQRSQATRASRSYATGMERLRFAQKSGAGDPAYLRWVNRGIGRRAASLAWVFGLSPNVVTAISAVLSLGGLLIVAIIPTSPAMAVTASFLLLGGYALDSADGQLARLTDRGSVAGEWLDHVVDATRLPLFHVAIAMYALRNQAQLWFVAVAVAFALLSSVWFFAQTLAEKLLPFEPPVRTAPLWVSFAKLPWDVGVLYLSVLMLAITPLFSLVYTALFGITAIVAIASLRRKYLLLSKDG